MKKRVISVLLCTAMVASMLIGCGGKTTSAEPESDAPEKGSAEDFDWKNYEGTEINVMFNEHNYSKAVIAKIPEFEELTGIKVKYTSTPESNYFDKLNTALSSRSGNPDVFMTGAYQVWVYAPAGYLEPLEDYIDYPALKLFRESMAMVDMVLQFVVFVTGEQFILDICHCLQHGADRTSLSKMANLFVS